jgi:hypothetical protein
MEEGTELMSRDVSGGKTLKEAASNFGRGQSLCILTFSWGRKKI